MPDIPRKRKRIRHKKLCLWHMGFICTCGADKDHHAWMRPRGASRA